MRLFAVDSPEEMRKIAEFAPKSSIFVRILYEGKPATWSLSRKFGISPSLAPDLLVLARDLDLQPRGVSFHVGSQMSRTDAWEIPLKACGEIFDACQSRGITWTWSIQGWFSR